MNQRCMRCAESDAYGEPHSLACGQCLDEQARAAEEEAEQKRGRAEMAADDEYARKRDEGISRE